MLEFEGKYSSCKVFVDVLEASAQEQILNFLNCPASEGMTLRFMPDCHAGAGCVIGFTGTFTDKIIPNLIGVDIGCGVAAIMLPFENTKDNIDMEKFDRFIRENVPSGRNIHPTPFDRYTENFVRVAMETGQNPDYVLKSLGTLGGGNHFIELNQDVEGHIWVVVHTGSRNFGLKVAKFHQNKATGPTKGLEWLEGQDAGLYFDHMEVAQHFAEVNRSLILETISTFFKVDCLSLYAVESVHNYMDFSYGIIRKGAISARKYEPVIIPWNMRDGTIIGSGLGNEDWNCSAPHGAGRVMGRKEACRKLKLEDFQKSMEGIWSSCVNEKTIDESPMAYKDCETIKAAITETVEIDNVLKPIYNFKAQD